MDYSLDENGNVARIMICGIGGGGGNAVNAMIQAGIKNVEFVVMNTDQQALSKLLAKKLPLGAKLTKGLGAGANPDIGRRAAEESKELIAQTLRGVDLLFIAAGMGGGTGTGAAPVVASIAQEMGILTIAVVTKPFFFEGTRRMRNADEGIKNLRDKVDAIVIVQNEKLNKDKNFSIMKAFAKADEILLQGIRGITDIVVQNGRINLDLADVKCVMRNSGMAHMGIGEGNGENKTINAIRQAVYSPLLETTIQGASSLIINFRGGEDLTLDEITVGVNLVRQVISPDANVLFGVGVDENMKDTVQVTLIATGFTGANDVNSSSFFSGESVSQTATTTAIPNIAGGSVTEHSPIIQRVDTTQQDSNSKSTDICGTVDVEEDPNIPPFLRKLKG